MVARAAARLMAGVRPSPGTVRGHAALSQTNRYRVFFAVELLLKTGCYSLGVDRNVSSGGKHTQRCEQKFRLFAGTLTSSVHVRIFGMLSVIVQWRL